MRPRDADDADPTPPRDDALHVELAARAAYLTPPIAGGTTPLGFGGGLALDAVASGFVLGASALAFAGGSDAGMSVRAVLVGGEVGYEWRITRRFALRPTIGAGGAIVTDVVSAASSSSASTTTGGARGARAPPSTWSRKRRR